MQRAVPRELLWAIIGALVVIVLSLSHALLKHPPYAPTVKAEQQSKGGLQPHQGNDAEHEAANIVPPGPPSVGGKGGGEGQLKTEHSEEEGTEFWPPFLGYRLKVTDTLVAAFTALLFFATVALWLATRRLVTGAEKTSEQQLRAYISLIGAHVQVVRTDSGRLFLTGNLELKNNGQTPAYRFAPWGMIDVLDAGIEPAGGAQSGQNSIFGPGATSNFDLRKGPLDASTIDAIRKEQKIIWIWCEIRYADAFGYEYIYSNLSRMGRLRQDGESWPLVAVRTTERKVSKSDPSRLRHA